MIPLNQTFRIEDTLAERPRMQETMDAYGAYMEAVGYEKTTRAFDIAISDECLDVSGKVVLELGARGSFWGPWNSDKVEHVTVSDNYEGFGGLGDEACWKATWTKYAKDPDRISCDFQDMRALTYEDNCADVVVCLSAIEHIPDGGDIKSAAEMGRVCKPGGLILMSLEMGKELYLPPGNHGLIGGTRLYTEESIRNRILGPANADIVGDYDFTYEGAVHGAIPGTDVEHIPTIFLMQTRKK